MQKTARLAHLYLFLVAVIYGANYTISKWVMDDEYIHPIGFIFFRVLVATILFFLTGLAIREKVDKKDHRILFMGGIFGVWINQTLFFYGLHLGSPVHASLLMLATPVLVLLIAAVVIGERITGRKILGVFLGLSGAIILILSSTGKSTESTLLGDTMVFINAISYAVYLVLVKKLTHKYHPVTISKWVFLYGAVFCLPQGFWHATQVQWATFSPRVWWSFIYVLIFTTYFAYLLNAIALRQVSAGMVSIYIYLQPLIAILIAILFYQSEINMAVGLGGTSIFSGVLLVSLSKEHLKRRFKGHFYRNSN
jgi:drug/metabolite transporter (DMT)-like permease